MPTIFLHYCTKETDDLSRYRQEVPSRLPIVEEEAYGVPGMRVAPRKCSQEKRMQKTLTISKHYEEDHDQLDWLFKSFQDLKRTDYSRACEYFLEFKFGLQKHMAWEEEILFPSFEEKTGQVYKQPVYLMKIEHRRIGALLELIHNKVREGDPDTDKEEIELHRFLENHNKKEEEILYPLIDNSVTQVEADSIFKQMNAL